VVDGTRDFIGLERRRRKAANLLLQGQNQAEVARQLGVSRQSVSRWARALREQGRDGLRRAAIPGRRPRSDAGKRDLIRRLLQVTPGPWTLPRLNQLINARLGVSFQRTRLIGFLREAGFAPRAGTGWIAHG
jgi:transposase